MALERARGRLTTLVEGGTFFESPRWRDGRWYVSDFYEHHVLSIDPAGRREVVMEVPGQPSGIGWMPDGSMLVVSMLDQRILRRNPGGEVTEHVDLSGLFVGPVNDMVVDAQGHAFVGGFGCDPFGLSDAELATVTTVLVRVDPNGRATVAAEDMSFPNGSVITPDGRTLIVGESMRFRYTAFTITDERELVERRVWGALPEDRPAGPDGCTLDAEGHLWMADGFGGPCRRLAPGAITVDEIEPPDGLAIFACALGGDDGRTLLLCAAGRTGYDGEARGQAALLTTRVDVPHVGLP